MRYDIAVIGNDEAALELLSVAGLAGHRTLGVIPEQRHSAWLISQALRRLVTQLLADRNDFRDQLYRELGTPGLLRRLLVTAVTQELEDHFRGLEAMGVDLLFGEARILDRNTILVTSGMDCRRIIAESSNLILGTGVRWTSLHNSLGVVPFARPEWILSGCQLPEQLSFLGEDAFVAGMAALFSVFGVATRLVTDACVPDASREMAELAGVRMFGAAEFNRQLRRRRRSLHPEIVDCRRAMGFTEYLNLPAIGIEPDENGRLWCADHLETWCTGVFGIGDVVGFSNPMGQPPAAQAKQILHRISHRVRRPHYLRIRNSARNAVF